MSATIARQGSGIVCNEQVCSIRNVNNGDIEQLKTTAARHEANIAQLDDQIARARQTRPKEYQIEGLKNVPKPEFRSLSSKNNDLRREISQKREQLQKQLDEVVASREQIQFNDFFPSERHFKGRSRNLPGENAPPEIVNGVEVPRNIKHMYKNNGVDELLQVGEDEMNRAAGQAKQPQAVTQRRILLEQARRQKPATPKSREYIALGNALRSNFSPGCSWNQTSGLEKETYTWDIFDKREKIDNQEWTMKKDQNTMWAEKYFLEQQQMKRWQNLADEKAAKG